MVDHQLHQLINQLIHPPREALLSSLALLQRRGGRSFAAALATALRREARRAETGMCSCVAILVEVQRSETYRTKGLTAISYYYNNYRTYRTYS